jgi:outer membrane protein assembly factor BamB
VCLVTDGFVSYDADGAAERRPSTTSEVAVLDTEDGHVVSRWDADPEAQVVALDGLAVAGTRRADGGIEVVGHDVVTGAQRWRHLRPATEPGDGGALIGPLSWTLSRVGDLVGVVDGGALTLLSPTGSLVREDLEASNDGFTFDTDPRTGGFSITTYSSTGAQTTTLLAPDGAPDGDLTVKGDLIRLVVDDGSVPGLVLTRFVHLQAWDRGTRDELWEANVPPAYAAIVARGLVYLTTSTEVIALDGRTGAVEWRVSVPLVGSATVATDGRDLLVLSVPDGTDGRMTGYDLATGERTREVTYPDGVSDVQLMHGVLVGWSSATEKVTVLE